jgi:fructose-1,6-bisphosphatase/inositol monophosphatase family enzyme
MHDMDDDVLLELLHTVATAVRTGLDGLEDWGPSGGKADQYRSDVAADEIAVVRLLDAGVGVVSEESGVHEGDREVVVVLDPLDGSTNAERGIPWFATSLCAVDAVGPRVAVVVDQARDARFEAVRGRGARCNGDPLTPSTVTELRRAVVGLSGFPPRWLGWKQYRALGAAALDLCAVAAGTLDAYIDCSSSAHGAWDYLGGLLVCREAGVVVGDAFDRELVTLDPDARLTPLAAATPELFDEVHRARKTFGDGPSGP